MKKEYQHVIRLVLFILITFFAVPHYTKYLALLFNPGYEIITYHFHYIIIAGMIILFALTLKNWQKLTKIKHNEHWVTIAFFIAGIIQFISMIPYHYDGIAYNQTTIYWTNYALLVIFFAIGILGYKFLLALWKDIIAMTLGILALAGITLLLEKTALINWNLRLVEMSVNTFAETNLILRTGKDPILIAENFKAIIGGPCTGIFGITLFTALFAFALWLDYKKINKKKATLYYLIGVIGIFLLNVIRIATLYYIGVNYSPELAITIFHNNAGWVLFALYSIVYWYFVYPKLLKK